jgi:hypothetical protein
VHISRFNVLLDGINPLILEVALEITTNKIIIKYLRKHFFFAGGFVQMLTNGVKSQWMMDCLVHSCPGCGKVPTTFRTGRVEIHFITKSLNKDNVNPAVPKTRSK